MKQLYIITGAKGHLASTIIRYLRKQDCERGYRPAPESEEQRQFVQGWDAMT